MTLPISQSEKLRASPLPLRQAETLALIDKALAEHGQFPPISDIRMAMGWKHDASVNDVLSRLAWRGRLRFGKAGEPKWVRVAE